MSYRLPSFDSPAVVTTLIAFLAVLLPATGQAQLGGGQLAVPNSPAFERAAATLRDASPRQYEFSKSTLSDVLRLMAEDAGISFFGLPDGSNGAERLVTFTINASPFSALETLAKANAISLIFDNGIWYLRPADDQELVGRIYQINYNSQEMIRKNDQTLSLGGGGGESGASSIGLDLQGSPDFFVREPSRLLDDIRGILDLGTTGSRATIAPTTSVDSSGQLSLAALTGQPNLVVRNPNININGDEGAGGNGATNSNAKVIWNSDSNSLYIVATRQQHQWIEGYLAAADQPQPMIAIQVQFIEISKDPRREFGVDWSGTFSEGRGWGGGLEIPDSTLNLQRLGDYALPTSAILSYDDVNVRLRALFNDTKSKIHSFPRMVTLDNREVSFRSVVNQPVLASSSAASLGAGATETNSVEYIPIGTVINILPKKMANDELMLNISITVSDIVGEKVINGNPFPVATSRVYTAPVSVENGYSVAISGLDQAETDETAVGIPVLGRIPILGHAFKARSERQGNQHLLMIITPRLLNQRTPGVTEDGIDYHPWTENTPQPQHPVAHPGPPVSAHQDFSKEAGFAAAPQSRNEAADSVRLAAASEPSGNRRLRLHERLFGKKNPSLRPEVAPTEWTAPEPATPEMSESVRAQPIVIASTNGSDLLESVEELDAESAVAAAEDSLAIEEPTTEVAPTSATPVQVSAVAKTEDSEVEMPTVEPTTVESAEPIAEVGTESDALVAPGQGLAWNDDTITTPEDAAEIETPNLSFEDIAEAPEIVPAEVEPIVAADAPIQVEEIIAVAESPQMELPEIAETSLPVPAVEAAPVVAMEEPLMVEAIIEETPQTTALEESTPSEPSLAFVEETPKPVVVEAAPDESQAVAPAPVAKDGKPRWEGEELAGGPKAVTAAVGYLEKAFADVDRSAPNAAETTSELYAESNRLLQFLQAEEEAAGQERPSFSEDWWKLIELKAKTKRATQQIAPNMVTTGDGELVE